MSDRTSFSVSSLHISRTTADLVQERITSGNGVPFFRNGERMAPMFGDMTFQVDSFARLYATDPERLEKALPHDLLFLHLFARDRGFDEMVITERVDTDPRLPVYLGNAIQDMGDILRDQDVKLSERKPRQKPEEDRIIAVSPKQIRLGKISLSDPISADPEPA